MINNYKIKKLNNGINLITVPVLNVDTVNTIVYFPVGSRYEEKDYNGISHFIEHMMFKGTERRPDTLLLSTELDSFGAIYNAYTGKDLTAYFIKSSKDYIEKNIDILADMLCNSKFDINEINKERGVIIQEMKRYEDLPEYYVEDVFEQLMFGENDKLGQLIVGTEKNVKNFTREQFINYKNTHYFGENCFICVVGNFNEEEVEKMIEDKFVFQLDGKREAYVEELRHGKKRNINQDKPKIKIVYRNIEQAHLKMGFPGFSYFDQESYLMSLFSAVFGECMSSRLFINIREKEGLCYHISSSHDRYQDVGIFSIETGLDKTRLLEALKLIKKELINVKNNGITEEELNKAKSITFGRMDVALEDTSNIAEFFGRQYLLQDKIITPEEKKNIINKITLKEINDIIQVVIDFSKFNLAIIGPYNGDDIEKIEEIIN